MPVGDVPRIKGENLLTGQILLQLIVISIVVQVLGYLSRRIGHHPVITCNAAQRSMNCAANFRLRQRCNGEGFLIKLVKII
jgi:hypothetical protein